MDQIPGINYCPEDKGDNCIRRQPCIYQGKKLIEKVLNYTTTTSIKSATLVPVAPVNNKSPVFLKK